VLVLHTNKPQAGPLRHALGISRRRNSAKAASTSQPPLAAQRSALSSTGRGGGGLERLGACLPLATAPDAPGTGTRRVRPRVRGGGGGYLPSERAHGGEACERVFQLCARDGPAPVQHGIARAHTTRNGEGRRERDLQGGCNRTRERGSVGRCAVAVLRWESLGAHVWAIRARRVRVL